MQVVEPVETMQLICKRLSREAKVIRLIPTMGSLHAGHASLIKRANEDTNWEAADYEAAGPSAQHLAGSTPGAKKAPSGPCKSHESEPKRAIIVVSIFVNPLQFNDHNDFIKYPISIEQDLALCERLNVDYVFMPKCQELVGDSGMSRKISVISTGKRGSQQTSRSRSVTLRPPDELAEDLEGKSRPNHFEGMLTIVCKLFNIIQPTSAYFGRKDYQQLTLVERMVKDLNMQVKIRPVDTVRDSMSNLPLSSRNSRLNEKQQQKAADLMFGGLVDGKRCLEDRCRRYQYDDLNANEPPNFDLDTILSSSLLAAQICSSFSSADEDAIHVDYFEIRCAQDLSVIGFDRALNLYDCQLGCIKTRLNRFSDVSCAQDAKILEARLLMSVVIAKVRLLDNLDVQLNL